ncbi:MAG TPA: hypothetical protein ACFYD7_05705 [Candidatus Wujingus californicus]|uniref:hypothetical protein n=1 Tax=Candidatus Wujingus californicus TaxID=3367618 RepID=UPI001D68955B|nr:hypothetical protein [Planctomycetota bacterium]MDO8094813.1 hypothetical protein [Candidatus Brocadiales bacterium]MDO8131746.1 hypothetical protein [Candidatus Brocadiales bacterium]
MKQQRYNQLTIIGVFADIFSFVIFAFTSNVFLGAVTGIIFFGVIILIVKPVAKKKIERVWLVIEKVELFGQLVNGQFNVKAFVNNTSYKYPSCVGVEWAKAGAGMSSQQFKLPVNEEGYEVYFIMNARRENECICELVSPKIDVIENLSKRPFQGQYNLYLKKGYTVDSGVLATVRYKIRTTSQ